MNPDAIKSAALRIKSIVHPTPVLPARFLGDFGKKVWLKLESLNIAGSFKIRGAFNAIMQMTPEQLKSGIIAASAGNHAQGIASTCGQLGVKSIIFMPEGTPLIKYEATLSMGAKVELVGNNIDDAITAATNYQKEFGGEFVHAYANEHVIAGQGTIGLELLSQIPDLSLVIVPIGGGGLISGISSAIKAQNPKIKIIGIQTDSFPSMKIAVETGDLSPLPVKPTIAEGIAIKRPHPLTVGFVKQYVDDIWLVSEDEVAATIMILMERGHLLVEGAGAVAVAALLKYKQQVEKYLDGGSAACIISGGNIDGNLLSRIMVRGSIYSGRRMKLRIRVPDRPGKLSSVLQLVGQTKANIIEIYHNRVLSHATQFGDVEIDIDLETINSDHQQKIITTLQEIKIAHEVIWPTAELAFS